MKRFASNLRPNAAPFLISRRAFTSSSICARQRKSGGGSRQERRPAGDSPFLPRLDDSHRPSGTSRASGGCGNSKDDQMYGAMRALAHQTLEGIIQSLGRWDAKNPVHRMYGFDSPNDLRQCAEAFESAIEHCFKDARDGKRSRADNPLFYRFRIGLLRGGFSGMETEIRFAFRSFAGHAKFSKDLPKSTQELVDFRYPAEWFPETRAKPRTIHLHVGPTNSGKTYHALKALEAAKTGIYAGPLRLLAHEIYSRLTAKGRVCALLTGEEQRIPEKADSFLTSCTVEMTPLATEVDVAVIDEIQMAADPDRGWAWTQAFLGVQAKEVHLCGEERSVDVIRRLCAGLGDELVIHEYKRLSPLSTMDKSLEGSLKNLQKGDAVVAFSRLSIHGIKAQIEKQTGKRCAVVYGSLPPETRAEQAALFNDPDNDYDFIAASDAIGMGLNLEIKRVIFDTIVKFDGMQQRPLHDPEIRQIGGRAGRFRTAARAIREGVSAPASPEDPGQTQPTDTGSPAVQPEEDSGGWVTCMNPQELKEMSRAFTNDAKPIPALGLSPPTHLIERIAGYFPPETPLAHVFLTIRDMCTLSDYFFLCDIDKWIEIADLIQPYPMPISDRLVFLAAPYDRRFSTELVKRLARCVSSMAGGHILEIPEIDLELLDKNPKDMKTGSEYLQKLEKLHNDVTLYLWLSYRFLGVFNCQRLAFHVKGLVEDKIRDQLNTMDYRAVTNENRERMVRKLLQKMKSERGILGNEGKGSDEEKLLEAISGEGSEASAQDSDLAQEQRSVNHLDSTTPGAGGQATAQPGMVPDSAIVMDQHQHTARAEAATATA